jgi:hypothetical protein
MRRIACLLGRHDWKTIVEHGESYRTCTRCGRPPRRRGRPPVSAGDVDYMKASGESDSSISSGF